MKYITLAAALALSACVGFTPVVSSKPVQLSSRQVAQIKATVVYDFFDPGSAQFRNIRAADVALQDGTRERRVCGEVNGKNRLGGYVGFTYFGGIIMPNGKFAKRDFFGPCEAT